MGRRISGSLTPASAVVTCSALGGETTEGAAMLPSYARGLLVVTATRARTYGPLGCRRFRLWAGRYRPAHDARDKSDQCGAAPVFGFSNSFAAPGWLNVNMSSMEPAMLSNEDVPVRAPPSQLFSMNARIEVVSMVALLT